MDSTLSTLKEIDKSEIATSINCDIENLSKHIHINKKDLTIITQNIRSVYKNINDLQVTLSNLKREIDILILTECRLDNSKNIPQLNNYTSFSTANHLNQNDGVVIFVKSKLNPKIKEINLDQASCLQIDIFNHIILGVYRSPSNANTDRFTESLRKHLNTIKTCKNIVLTGDININLIQKYNETSLDHKNRHNYLNMLSTFGLLPGHMIATRENSCLDHFMLKLHKKMTIANIAVLNTTVTDHLMVLCSLAKIKITKEVIKKKTYIDFDKALITLANKNLSSLLFCDDPNNLLEMLTTKITESLQENTLTMTLPKNQRTIKPWITQGVLRCIRNRNKMQKQLKCNPDDEILKIAYKSYRNFCNNLIKKLKRVYDRKLLLAKNPKVLWNNIKNLTNLKHTKTTNIELLDIESCPVKAINLVNSFFVNVGPNLAKEIETNNQLLQHTEPIHNHNYQLSSFVILNTDHEEVSSILMNLKSNSAAGFDNIPTKFLKLSKELIVPILTYLGNLCFTKGVFPSLMKQSIITPVYKNGDRAQINNYRPISVLTGISKVMEKLINNRLTQYLNKFNILSASQYGFRQGKCTQDAILDLTSCIVDHLDSKNKCLTVFLDLKKAFDTVSVPILIKKLENIGIRDNQLNLMKDYLSDRTQRVKIGDYRSNDLKVTFGVPQGSVLGPTLFLIYINELCDLKIDNGHIYSYADDTAIVFHGKTWKEVHSTAEIGLRKISSWLKSNVLTLNTNKSNYICFSINKKTQPTTSNLQIHHCNDQSTNCTCPTIDKIGSTKYLGIVIDQRLSWHSHLELLSSRIRKLIWIFKTLRYVATNKVLTQVYTALAESILSYCIPVWGGASKIKFLELERSQRALLKVMFSKPYHFPTKELYSINNLLSVRKVYILQLILQRHKTVIIDINTKTKRRVNIRVETGIVKTKFASHQFAKKSAYVYKKVNSLINIYSLNSYKLKKVLTDWLTKLSYEEIEALFDEIT